MTTTDRITTTPEQGTPEAAVLEALKRITEGASAKRVYAEPITQDGVTIVPAATMRGGGGGGGGNQPAAEGAEAEAGEGRTGKGLGAGLGMSAKPAGAFVLKGGKVDWRPAIDVNKVILGAQVVAITALLTLRALIRARAEMAEYRARPEPGMLRRAGHELNRWRKMSREVRKAQRRTHKSERGHHAGRRSRHEHGRWARHEHGEGRWGRHEHSGAGHRSRHGHH